MPHKDPERRREYRRKWLEANREGVNARSREYRRSRAATDDDYRDRRNAQARKLRANNPAYRIYNTQWCRNKRATDPVYRARRGLEAQERAMRNRDRVNELARAAYHKRKARREAEWNEIMAEIQGASNV